MAEQRVIALRCVPMRYTLRRVRRSGTSGVAVISKSEPKAMHEASEHEMKKLDLSRAVELCGVWNF